MDGALEGQISNLPWPPGDAAMARRIRAHDWVATPLGPIGSWSPRHRVMVETMLATADVSSLVCGPERILIYNDAAACLYGNRHPSALGQPLPDAFPEGWATVAPFYASAFAGETVQVVAQPLDTRGEGWATDSFDAMLVPVRDEAGAVVAVLMTGREVGARVRAEEALRLGEARFRALVTATSYAVYSMGPDWTEMRQLQGHGFLADTAGPNTAWLDEYILPEDRPRIWAAIQQAIRTKDLFELEHRVRRADGAIGWTVSRAVPLLDAAGEIREWFGAASDVTQRREAEAALANSEARYRALVEGMPQLVWRSAAQGEWTWASPQWEAFTGLSDAESRGRGWLAAMHPHDRESAMAAWARAGEAGVFEADFRLWCAGDGAWRWFQTRGLPMGDAAGSDATEWLGTSTNVDDQMLARDMLENVARELEERVAERTAELQAAEANLRQSQKMDAVGQLAGGIAHDFNNMLQGIIGGVEMARRRVATGRAEEASRYLEAAREAAERAAGLTRRLLAFARQQRLEPRPVDVDALVAGMADLVRRTVGPGIALELRLHNGLGKVLCDPNELENVLLNLCINGRDAMPDGGHLTVCTADLDLTAAAPGPEILPGKYVSLTVTDTGTGMSPEVLERAFDPFFTTKPLGQGTGLGLSQVWGFAHQSGGLVRAESRLGHGTTFYLLLPFSMRAAATSEPKAEPAPPQPGAGGTILLVDDEAAVRGPAADRLRELGHTVLEASDGPEALQILAAAPPDMLIADLGLPGGIGGQQVATIAQELWPGLPVLFVTGYAANVPLPSGMEVIGKPFALDDLARRVRDVLATTG